LLAAVSDRPKDEAREGTGVETTAKQKKSLKITRLLIYLQLPAKSDDGGIFYKSYSLGLSI
jgi:hypothetical protein